MSDPKTFFFVAGLPRSGSTLMMNLLGQNPRYFVTPTSGILDVLVQVRNGWARNVMFQALDRAESEKMKQQVLKAILQAAFAHVEQPVCFDKNRGWCDFLEMAEVMVGGRDKVKCIITVRDLRDVVASFEKLYRKTSALGQIPQELPNEPLRMKTAVNRCRVFISDGEPIGRAFNAIRDAATRGWLSNILFVEYDELTRRTKETLSRIYSFLGEEPFDHNLEHVEQITFEDDFVHGFKDLHKIRPKIEPQSPQWPHVFDRVVLEHEVWKGIERNAQFWRAYTQPSGGVSFRAGPQAQQRKNLTQM